VVADEGGARSGAADDDELAVRRSHLQAWRRRGVDPYGGRFPRTHSAREIVDGFQELEGCRARVAGRLVRRRLHGRVAFADLQDGSGRLQLFLRADVLGSEGMQALADLDLGDIVGAEGVVCRTRTGEISLAPDRLQLLAKALRPLPAKWHGLHDPDLRHRQRHLDLLTNESVRTTFVRRSQMIAAVRRHLDERGFLEVETPVLQPIAAGAEARPFRTHHRALDMDLFLRIALELHLKRLIVGGLEAVYEIGRVFRNEGVSTRHNPEFTMLECYQAYADYTDMMALTEGLFAAAAMAVRGSLQVRWQGREIDLSPPWRRLSIVEALASHGFAGIEEDDDERARARARARGVAVEEDARAGEVIDALVEHLILPELVQPTFLVDHPVAISPLAKARPDAPGLALRFEAVIGAMEMANAYSELNDPDEQRRRFLAQAQARGAEGGIDEDYVRALEQGMPPTGGLGVGMDRMAMLLTDASSIREVILFPLVRPAGGGVDRGRGGE
jgi:lysyl-tRNA synthetase class 2